jgi:DNA-binding LytR/AlgR family response regulator
MAFAGMHRTLPEMVEPRVSALRNLLAKAGLDPARFVRIHRSYIVNFERIARIEPYGKDSRTAILTNGTRLPISRAGYARLKSLMDDRE